MTLSLYNTRSKQKEVFKSLREGVVSMYVCGPTVYDLLHIGNFRGVIFFNVVRNWLEHLGYSVKYVLNFTDIDDKIIVRSQEKNMSASELTEYYIKAFQDDLSLLSITPHDVTPKCTEHMDDIVTFIQGLIAKNVAYEVDGSVLVQLFIRWVQDRKSVV